MYVPEHFRFGPTARQHAFIEAHGFGLLISTVDGVPFASHIPLELDVDEGELGTLRGHVARANPHADTFDGQGSALAVFTSPHAYISPSWYPEGKRVPTWNYVAVHVTGTPQRIDDAAAVEALLERSVVHYEGADGWQTSEQDAGFLRGMRRGVVAFEMPIERIEGKAKLGQNHSQAHRSGAVAGLRSSGGDTNSSVADWMQRQLDGEF